MPLPFCEEGIFPMADDLIPLLQRIEAATARANEIGRDVLLVPPFQLSFHPTDTLIYLNYAMPLTSFPPSSNPLTAATLEQLREAFGSRNRVLRFEFLESLWPDLPGHLEAAGMVFESRMPLMLCGPEDLCLPRAVDAVLETINEHSPDATFEQFLAVRRASFSEIPSPPRPGELDETRTDLGTGKYRSLAAGVDGRLVAIASLTVANDELVGVATLPAYRGRGLAAALCGALLQNHFARGAAHAWLTAADASARRLYERLGFRTAGSALSYVEATLAPGR
jgi:ribosomal protein S18 acetylase RimI-like enzyme